jgi:hypothetical protein
MHDRRGVGCVLVKTRKGSRRLALCAPGLALFVILLFRGQTLVLVGVLVVVGLQ